MAFNVQNFSDNLAARGTLQTNKFEVRMTAPNVFFTNDIVVPAGRRSGFLETSRNLRFRAESVNLPGVLIDAYETRRHGVGPQQKFGTNVRFSEFSVTFIEEGSSNIYEFFYYWINSIFDTGGYMSTTTVATPIPTYLTSYKSEYITDVEVRVYDNQGNQKNSVTFIEAFPLSLGDVSLSWSDNNRLFRTSVTFGYTQWSI